MINNLNTNVHIYIYIYIYIKHTLLQQINNHNI